MNRQYSFYDNEVVINSNNTNSKVIPVRDFRHIVLDLVVSWSANLTFKVYWANWDIKPNVSNAVSATNRYYPIQIVDRNNWTNITGATWVTYTWTSDGWQSYEINTDWLDFVVIRTTAYTAGSIDLKFHLYDND